MEPKLPEVFAVLSRTPRVLRSLLADLPSAFVLCNEGENTFSPFDVVGHLVEGERSDWMPRVRIILGDGEASPFKPFDRFAMLERDREKNLGDLLLEFEQLRERNLQSLRELDLQPADRARTGTHPEFGRVTLGQLIATWVVHDLGHIAQVTRVMSARYREAVGPWREYLPVLSARP